MHTDYLIRKTGTELLPRRSAKGDGKTRTKTRTNRLTRMGNDLFDRRELVSRRTFFIRKAGREFVLDPNAIEPSFQFLDARKLRATSFSHRYNTVTKSLLILLVIVAVCDNVPPVAEVSGCPALCLRLREQCRVRSRRCTT